MSRTVTINIYDPVSVANGVSEIQQHIREYSNKVRQKTEELRRRVAFLIATNAREMFNYAVADDLLNEGYIIGGVDVTVEHNGNVTLVIANGKDAVFMEFGSGIYHNGSVGTSPNPLGAGLGFTIGSYGKGNGAKNVWGFKGEDGEMHLSHGVPASMPMYRSMMGVVQNIERIAREVFST